MLHSGDHEPNPRLSQEAMADALFALLATDGGNQLEGWCLGFARNGTNLSDGSHFAETLSSLASRRLFGSDGTAFVLALKPEEFRASLRQCIDLVLAGQSLGPTGTVMQFVVAQDCRPLPVAQMLRQMVESGKGQETMTVLKLGTLVGDGFAGPNDGMDRVSGLESHLNDEGLRSIDQGIFAAGASSPEIHETLARFAAKDGTVLSATAVLGGDESDALLSRLDQAMLHRGLGRLEEDDSLRLSINVCRTSLLDEEWLETLEVERSRSGEAFKRAVLEITEWPARASHHPLSSSTRDIVSMGIPIWLDDFGAGLTSFNEVLMPGVTGLKIDRSMLRLSLDLGDDFGLIEEVTRFARALDLVCVVEGAETDDERAFAEARGATHVQGFFSGRV